MKKQILSGLATGALMLGMAGVANATLVTSIPDGNIISIPAVNYIGEEPQTFDSGNITWSATNASTQGSPLFGWDWGYGFGSNGNWFKPIVMAGLNEATSTFAVTDSMTFSFSSPVKAVGGFINYYPDAGDQPVISVYDASNTLIESATLNFSTSGDNNTGKFYGFSESNPSIKYFTLTDAYIGITDLTTTSNAPEPASVILIGTGIAGISAMRRKKKQQSETSQKTVSKPC